MYYFIVIKKKNLLVTDKTVTDHFNEIGPNLITFESPNKNPHYHIILDTTKSIDAIRNKITRKFDLPRGYKSVKQCESLERSYLYILKEQTVKNNTILTPEELDAYRIASEKITIEKKQSTSFKRLFRQNFDVVQMEQLDTDEEKLQFIYTYIIDTFKANDEFWDHRKIIQYHNYSLMNWLPHLYVSDLMTLFDKLNQKRNKN